MEKLEEVNCQLKVQLTNFAEYTASMKPHVEKAEKEKEEKCCELDQLKCEHKKPEEDLCL